MDRKISGTIEGGRKARDTNLKNHGADFYKKIGKNGGQNGTTGGFYANRELAREAGKKGGQRSSRLGIKNGQGVTRRKNEYTSDNK